MLTREEKIEAITYLKEFKLTHLFTQVLLWERFEYSRLAEIDGAEYTLTGIAHKRGVQVFLCGPDSNGKMPDSAARQKIDRQISKIAYERLVIFHTADRSEQLWVYPRKEKGKPARLIPYRFDHRQRNEPLLQKLESIAFTIDEEDELTLFDVQKRLKDTLDRDKLTKKFYDEFSKQRTAFQKFLKGIPDKDMARWYVAVLINRLMFIYFIQEKGFLGGGDTRYLQNRLMMFDGNYYRDFLCPLFFQGFALREYERPAKVQKMLGTVPYLNGGIFQEHEIEKKYGKNITIPNEAFEKLYTFFDKYHWHLDERPLRNDNEINPDVLGYIFEKYINQKQMGAYYTKEDITEYITKNTVIPYLFEAAKPKCRIAFDNPDGPTVWDLLRDNPDTYIYPAMKHGVTWRYDASHPEYGTPLGEPVPYPELIAIGLDTSAPDLLERRKHWNTPAPPEAGLPTEIWRETVARRQRYEEVRQKLASGEVRDINDLITLNLDIRQFAQDAITHSEGPELLRAFWKALEKVSVLDPTCGSGAFLFAALNILESLYLACLQRMQDFLDDLGKDGKKHSPEKYKDFRDVLARVAEHPNREYFIYKNIILNNLYGVDIMEEAVEICKLRLFLKLAAQVEPDSKKPNIGIEPLPDIDFNIRAGNTLVGYTTYADVEKAVTSKLDFDDAMGQIKTKAQDLQQAFDSFRKKQTEGDGSIPAADKKNVGKQLRELEEELNLYLAKEYGINPEKKKDYVAWLASHQPFHWFIEFYGIMSSGGFDVIVGNPPFVENKEVESQYRIFGFTTYNAGNLFAYTWERALCLSNNDASVSFIIPVASLSTDRYKSLQTLWRHNGSVHASCWNDRPDKLFDGLEHIRLTIVIHNKRIKSSKGSKELFVTRYHRWNRNERTLQFQLVKYTDASDWYGTGIPKFGSVIEQSIMAKLSSLNTSVSSFLNSTNGKPFYYTRKLSGFVQIIDFIPKMYDSNGKKREPSELKQVDVIDDEIRDILVGVLNTNLFYWYLNIWSDCRNLNKREVLGFTIKIPTEKSLRQVLLNMTSELMADYQSNSKILDINYQKYGDMRIQCIYPKYSKKYIDNLDQIYGSILGLSELELDLIINYEIKYRMGLNGLAGEEE